MSSGTTRGSRNKDSFQQVQEYCNRLQRRLNNNDGNYIATQMIQDLKHILSFQPNSHEQYNEFSKLYNKIMITLIQSIDKYNHNYYYYFLFCIRSLLGYGPYECYIFTQQHDVQSQVINIFYENIENFITKINTKKNAQNYQLFDILLFFNILYDTKDYVRKDIFNQIYGHYETDFNMKKIIEHWINNMDSKTIDNSVSKYDDDLEYFKKLFNIIDKIYNECVFHVKNYITNTQWILNLQLIFTHKLLLCNKRNKHVQSLQLLEHILDKAKHYRNICCDFLLRMNVLNTLMSPQYIHSELLTRIKPIIILLCDCNAITMDIMVLLYIPSKECNLTELKAFNQLFVLLSQYINSVHLLQQFFDDCIYPWYINNYNNITEIHLDFVEEYTQNIIKKQPNNFKENYEFNGFKFLRNCAIDFNLKINGKIRNYALDKIKKILQNSSHNIIQFLMDTINNIGIYIQREKNGNGIDLTYVIHGIHGLFKLKRNETIKRPIITVMIEEIVYYYSYCHNSNNKNKIIRKNFKLRFEFIKTIASKTNNIIQNAHVEKLQDVIRKYTNSDIANILQQQLNNCLNECAKLNKNNKMNAQMLDEQVIQKILRLQFDEQMDINKFKSCIGFFHDINHQFYNSVENKYKFIDIRSIKNKQIHGLHDMWNVIKGSKNFDIVILMIDELIQLYHAANTDTICNDHIQLSDGIKQLFNECNKQFNASIISTEDGDIAFKMEPTTIKYLILLRRIIEFSIGKKSSVCNDQKIQLKIYYRFHGNNYNNKFNIFNMDNISLNTTLLDIRKRMAKSETIRCKNARNIQLYRRHKDRFIVIEEHSLLYLTCNDLVIFDKKTKMHKIEFEILIRNNNNNNNNNNLSKSKSISQTYIEDYHKFMNVKRLSNTK